jgi:PAS domain S-box-containing protein
MVMLEDKNKACLTYLASYGYNPKDENYLKSIEFHLDNPASKGPAIQVFKNQIPVLVNDVTEIEKNLSKKSLEFLHNMNSRSFICVPIVYKMEAMGILMADNVQSKKRLSQTDMNLLAGVAQQIGIGIKNAVFYQRITESEERFRALSENSPDIIYMLDNRGMFTYVNPAWKRILGHEKEEVIGKSLTDFTKKEDENVLVSGLKDIGDRGRRIYGYNGSILHKDGSERMFLMSGAPNTDSGGRVTGIVGTFKDITDLKRAEDEKAVLEEKYRQAQKMEAIGQLAGGVAHDFNNMLNVVIGYSQLALMNMEPSDPLYKNIQEIINAGERSADLVRQLLSFARKQTIAPKAMNLNTAVSGTLNMLRKLIGEGIEIIWQPAPDLRLVTMDPAQMDQLLTNLIVNARDSISSVGRITIKTGNAELHESNLTQQTDPLPGHYVMLSVADNGCGMDRETLEKIFDPFFTTKEVGKGTGMGLATVYGIVKQNKGVISVSSKPGMGTEFKIYLPMRKESEISAAAGTASREGPLIGRETVLFVEDNEAVLKVSKTMLEKLGYTVVATRSPGEAVQLAERYAGDIHLLVTDIIMPEMNGYDLKKQISGIRPGIRCLFISGYTDNKVVNEDVHDGKAHFLQKPFFMNDLAEKVREALR